MPLLMTELEKAKEREVILTEKLNIYSEKFDSFQNSITEANSAFKTYNKEINSVKKEIH